MTEEEEGGGGFLLFSSQCVFPREDDLGCEASAFSTLEGAWIVPNLPITWEGILGARPCGHCPSHPEPGDTMEPQQSQRAWNSPRILLGMPQ